MVKKSLAACLRLTAELMTFRAWRRLLANDWIQNLFDWFFGKKFESGAFVICCPESFDQALSIAAKTLTVPYTYEPDSQGLSASLHHQSLGSATQGDSWRFEACFGESSLFELNSGESVRFCIPAPDESPDPYWSTYVNFERASSEIFFWRNARLNETEELRDLVIETDLRFFESLTTSGIEIDRWWNFKHSPDLSGFGAKYGVDLVASGQGIQSLRELLES